MMTNPKPVQTFRTVFGNGTIMNANARRPELARLFLIAMKDAGDFV